MICKKCCNKEATQDGTHKCTIDGCKFKIPRDHSVCRTHSRKLNLCEACGKPIGATRRKGAAED